MKALPASTSLFMMSLAPIIILAARIVTVTSSADGNMASSFSLKPAASNELTSPAAMKVAQTTDL